MFVPYQGSILAMAYVSGRQVSAFPMDIRQVRDFCDMFNNVANMELAKEADAAELALKQDTAPSEVGTESVSALGFSTSPVEEVEPLADPVSPAVVDVEQTVSRATIRAAVAEQIRKMGDDPLGERDVPAYALD